MAATMESNHGNRGNSAKSLEQELDEMIKEE